MSEASKKTPQPGKKTFKQKVASATVTAKSKIPMAKLTLKTICTGFFIASFIYLSHMLKFISREYTVYSNNEMNKENKTSDSEYTKFIDEYNIKKKNISEFRKNYETIYKQASDLIAWADKQDTDLEDCIRTSADKDKCVFSKDAPIQSLKITIPENTLPGTMPDPPVINFKVELPGKITQITRCDDGVKVYKNILIVIMTLQCLFAIYLFLHWIDGPSSTLSFTQKIKTVKGFIVISGLIGLIGTLVPISIAYVTYDKLSATTHQYNDSGNKQFTCIHIDTLSQVSKLKACIVSALVFLSIQFLVLYVS